LGSNPTVGRRVLFRLVGFRGSLASAYGGGGRNPPKRPNVLRLRLATLADDAGAGDELPADGLERDELIAIRCNIDDAGGELLGADFVDAALAAGARDVVICPAVMKKGRPGHVVEVLAEPDRAEALALFLLENTTTIGVRMAPVRRWKLPREAGRVKTAYGEVAVKTVRLPGGTVRTTPEYSSCREVAGAAGVPVQRVYRAAMQQSRGQEA